MIEIEEIEKSNEITSILLSALNDWPNPVENLVDFESQIKTFINNETTLDNIKLSLSKIDFSKNSWQAESMSQLIELFTFFEKSKNLEVVFKNISKEIIQ